MARLKSSRGFTLIEIVLVLAIAALILVVVFLAISGAQKARRDHQRKNDAAALVAAVISYAGNHFLKVPQDSTEMDDLMAAYFTPRSDPLVGTQYVADYHWVGADHDLNESPLPSGGCTAVGCVPDFGHIAFVLAHACGSDLGAATLVADPPALGVNSRHFAVIIRLEQGNYYCLSGRF